MARSAVFADSAICIFTSLVLFKAQQPVQGLREQTRRTQTPPMLLSYHAQLELDNATGFAHWSAGRVPEMWLPSIIGTTYQPRSIVVYRGFCGMVTQTALARTDRDDGFRVGRSRRRRT